MIVSPTSIKSAGGYSSYLGREVYFQKGDGTPVPGIAFGKLAEELGFKAGEAVNIEDVRALMEGINPDLDGEAWSEKDRVFKERVAEARAENTREDLSSPKNETQGGIEVGSTQDVSELSGTNTENRIPDQTVASEGLANEKESKEDLAFRNTHNLSKEDMQVIRRCPQVLSTFEFALAVGFAEIGVGASVGGRRGAAH
jgi:hypothetical protein